MRNNVIFRMFLAAAVILLAFVGAFSQSDRDNDAIGYNVLAERLFEGTVAAKEHSSEGLVYFPLRTANTLVEVQIGPKEFVERNSFKLRAGDRVTVIGMPVVMKGRDVVLAREVRSTKDALIIRDSMGLPLWDKTDKPLQICLERQIRFGAR